jgi:hypothetical protein
MKELWLRAVKEYIREAFGKYVYSSDVHVPTLGS